MASIPSPTLVLTPFDTWDDYLATRSSNFRQDLRRKERKLQRDHELSFRLTADRSRLDRDVDTFFSLHSDRWATGSSLLETSRIAFHREFAGVAFDRGWLRLWFLEIDGDPVAAWYGFRYDGIETYYQAGRALAHTDGSLGVVLLAHTIREALADGIEEYRLGPGGYHHPIMLQDAARAVRLVRARADEWKIDAKRVGIMGSSAGGHLASTLLTHFDAGKADASDPVERQSSRPDVGILCYAVITMGPNTHQGSKNNLLGKEPDPELVKNLSNETQVTKDTAPTFLWHTQEDTAVKVENSLEFAAALQRAHVPFDLHVYQKGGHGMGLGNAHPWAKDCVFWLRVQKFVK